VVAVTGTAIKCSIRQWHRSDRARARLPDETFVGQIFGLLGPGLGLFGLACIAAVEDEPATAGLACG
jgi:hypothetical protein